jgi:ferredoxin
LSVGVAICADLASHGLDPEAISELLDEQGVASTVIPGPCGRPPADDAVGWARVVLAVCPQGPSEDEVRNRARRGGADPGVGATRVDAVEAAAHGDRERVGERLAAVLGARATGLAATPPSPQDAFRMALAAGKMSRRSLLSAAGVSYVPVATVGEVGCRGSVACGLCVDACPVAAIDRGLRVPQVDREACVGCGACVSACPVDGAARLPGADLERFEAELGRLVREAAGAGLLVRCAGSPPIPEHGLEGDWLPVDVPCLSIVTAAWALGVLAAGARSIAFRGCGDRCRADAPSRVSATVTFVRDALAMAGVGAPEDRVRLLLPEDDMIATGPDPAGLAPLGEVSGAFGLREPGASEAALAAIGVVGGSVTGDGAPFGRVGFDADGCTMCGLCAGVCPTGAIRFDQGPITATLELDRSACVGCGHCAAICPEGVLSVERGVDLVDLGRGIGSLKRSPVARCRRCGEPVAPTAMLERMRPLLDPAVLATTEGLCQRCRGLG